MLQAYLDIKRRAVQIIFTLETLSFLFTYIIYLVLMCSNDEISLVFHIPCLSKALL